MPLDDFYNKIKTLAEFDLAKEATDIINQNSYYIEGLLRLQLQEGKDGKGKNVTVFGKDYYSDATIQDKRYNGIGLGKFTEWITNYNSGSFYMSLKTHAENGVFETTSNVNYFEDIIKRSGSVIMELNEDSLKNFSEEILFPQLQSRFKARFNGF